MRQISMYIALLGLVAGNVVAAETDRNTTEEAVETSTGLSESSNIMVSKLRYGAKAVRHMCLPSRDSMVQPGRF
jgi:hypothetical protein